MTLSILVAGPSEQKLLAPPDSCVAEVDQGLAVGPCVTKENADPEFAEMSIKLHVITPFNLFVAASTAAYT